MKIEEEEVIFWHSQIPLMEHEYYPSIHTSIVPPFIFASLSISSSVRTHNVPYGCYRLYNENVNVLVCSNGTHACMCIYRTAFGADLAIIAGSSKERERAREHLICMIVIEAAI